ncbi:MAG: hypothetical protein AAB658_08020 [Chloroflexota bacterium]
MHRKLGNWQAESPVAVFPYVTEDGRIATRSDNFLDCAGKFCQRFNLDRHHFVKLIRLKVKAADQFGAALAQKPIPKMVANDGLTNDFL